MCAGKYFFLSVVYASNDEIDRMERWDKLRMMEESMPPSPWLALGDFNVVFQMSECSEFSVGMIVPSKVQEFQDYIRDVGLVDISSKGPSFTWTNKRTEGFLARKLDRAMANLFG